MSDSASSGSGFKSAQRMPRVAVIGAGIAGCSAARVMKDAGADVEVFEMGFGPGGRMASRKTREVPGLSINHGAPFFSVNDAVFQEFLQPYISEGVVAPWTGKRLSVDFS
eukprot:CAMPEP_0113665304 /NCGR_PEP_ID=MMETSP0038_2-20120614/2231_1 /TAXON_ID=2898 /ORGANISM="Cryptomonas paramecium" /LENGTH=109 /DNA_ID=CAMNT_0000580643 /DNA_START=80 /DNA_END=405 /DNA_ORIENTATION=+ /assembly_acc=CAM_ASM_000170